MKLKHIFIVSLLFTSLVSFSQKQFAFSGLITDSNNGKALDGIDIVVKENLTGTISSNKGSYLLYLEGGNYQVTFSGNGYKEKEICLNLTDNSFEKIELVPEVKALKKQQRQHKKQSPTSIYGKSQEIISQNTNSL